jgi:small Trp-rich protein
MAFLCLGLALLAMKLAEFGSVAAWSWWVVLLPFGLATAWWAFADGIGLTQRRAMGKMEAKKTERRNRNLDALGLGPRRDVKARRDSRFNTAATGRHAAKDPTMAAAAEEVGRR